jgi:hypothetical protein
MYRNNNGCNQGLKTLHFNYNIFSFSNSGWVDKDQIALYFVLKLFYNAKNCSIKMHMYIFINM